MLIVQKFGGSSLADISGLRRAAEIILNAKKQGIQVVAVVSAMGDSTDELSELAHRINPKPPKREIDALLSTGEQQSAALLSIMLCHLGCEARSFSAAQAGIFTDGQHGDANISIIFPDKILSCLARGHVAVVAGFQGMGNDGSVTTLGRGGSDTSAVALAAALKAERCEIYKDVDGIFTADPMLVSGAKLLDRIDFRDMHALSLCGSQVLHSRSVYTAMKAALPMLVLSSFKKCQGSSVCLLEDSVRPDFAGLTRNRADHSLSLVGKAVDSDCLEKLCSMLFLEEIDIISADLCENRLSIFVPPEHLNRALQLVHKEIFETEKE